MQLINRGPSGEINRLFDNEVASLFPKLFGWDFAVDIYEKNGNVYVKMMLPDVAEEEVDVSIKEDILTVSGRRDEEKEVKEKEYHTKEIRRGSFSRTIQLPKIVDAEKATARYDKGVVMVVVPVMEGAKENAVKIPFTK